MPRISAKNEKDQKRLKVVANDLVKALAAENFENNLRFKRQQMWPTDTDGWCVQIGNMGKGLPRLCVYLGRINGGHRRQFWFGFFASELDPVAKAKDAYQKNSGSREVGDSDLIEIKNGHFKFKTSLSKSTAQKPLLECYERSKAYYFGIYDLTPNVDDYGVNINLARKFLISIVRQLVRQFLAQDLGRVEKSQRGFFQRLIRDRQGKFRNAILQAYNNTCAITGCKIQECLEAAHLDRYSDSCDNRVTNGILLRADLHRLLDSGKMTFVWSQEKITIKVNASVQEGVYRSLDNKAINCPLNRDLWPSKTNIDRHANKDRGHSVTV